MFGPKRTLAHALDLPKSSPMLTDGMVKHADHIRRACETFGSVDDFFAMLDADRRASLEA